MEWPGTYIQIGVPQTSNNVKSSFHKTPSSSSAGTCTQTETRDLIALHCNVWWSAESDHSLKWELVWLIWKIKPLSNMNTGVNCQVFDGIMKYGHTTEAARQLCKGHHSFSLKHSKVDLHIWKNVSGNKSFDILMQEIQSHRRAKVPLPTLRQLCKGHQRHSLFFVVNISVDLQFWWNNISKNINLTLDEKHPFCHLMLRQHVRSAVGQSCKLQRPLSHHFEIMSRWSRVFSALQLQCI